MEKYFLAKILTIIIKWQGKTVAQRLNSVLEKTEKNEATFVRQRKACALQTLDFELCIW